MEGVIWKNLINYDFYHDYDDGLYFKKSHLHFDE